MPSGRQRRRSRQRTIPCSTARWVPVVCTSAKPCTAPWANNLLKLIYSKWAGGRSHRDRPFSWGVCKLAREIGDGLGVDLALVPLLQHREIGGAGLVILAALPAI